MVQGLEELRAIARPISRPRPSLPESASAPTRSVGSRASSRRRRSAACYGRIGTCTQEFGTLASWLVDVVNVLTGNLDRPGGAMFTTPAASLQVRRAPHGAGRRLPYGRWKSRVRGLPEFGGELPAVALAEEIETPGEGQIRGARHGRRQSGAVAHPTARGWRRALDGLDFMVSIDIYVNETTRHANLILPTTSPLEHENYDLLLYNMAIRNVAKYSPADGRAGAGREARLGDPAALAARLKGTGPADLQAVDDSLLAKMVDQAVASAWRAARARSRGETALAAPRFAVPDRTGCSTCCFAPAPTATASTCAAAVFRSRSCAKQPHGIDLGPLEPQLPEVLATPSGKIELAPRADRRRRRAPARRSLDARRTTSC